MPLGKNLISATYCGLRGSYPQTPRLIVQMVREHFTRAGVGLPPSDEVRGEPPAGIVVPHLDFRVGGHVYPHGFGAMAEREGPDQVIVLGVAHRAAVDVAVSRRGFSGPLGSVRPAMDLYDALRSQCSEELFEVDECECFDGEHSLEFPITYLQALGRIYPERKDFEVLCVVCGGMQTELEEEQPLNSAYEEFGRALSRVLDWSAKKISLIVSIDGAHVGPRFGADEGVTEKQLVEIRSADKDAFSVAALGGAESFFETFLPTLNERNFDGVGAMYVALRALENKASFDLRCYDQWFWPPDESVVSLAAGVFLHNRQSHQF